MRRYGCRYFYSEMSIHTISVLANGCFGLSNSSSTVLLTVFLPIDKDVCPCNICAWSHPEHMPWVITKNKITPTLSDGPAILYLHILKIVYFQVHSKWTTMGPAAGNLKRSWDN